MLTHSVCCHRDCRSRRRGGRRSLPQRHDESSRLPRQIGVPLTEPNLGKKEKDFLSRGRALRENFRRLQHDYTNGRAVLPKSKPQGRTLQEGFRSVSRQRASQPVSLLVTEEDDDDDMSSFQERNRKFLEKKEQKLDKIRKEMMEECTFAPETNHCGGTSSSAGKSVQSKGSCSTWERLYCTGTASTPVKWASPPGKEAFCSSNSTKWSHVYGNTGTLSFDKPVKLVTPNRDTLNQNKSTPGAQTSMESKSRVITITPKSHASVTPTADMSRISELYMEGVRKNRALTDKAEAQMRKRRWEERELLECTFKPKMEWAKETKTPQAEEENITTSSEENTIQDQSMGSRTLDSIDDMPPVEIITTSKVPLGFKTPPQVYVVSAMEGHLKDLPPEEKETEVKRSLGPAFDATWSECMETEYGSI